MFLQGVGSVSASGALVGDFARSTRGCSSKNDGVKSSGSSINSSSGIAHVSGGSVQSSGESIYSIVRGSESIAEGIDIDSRRSRLRKAVGRDLDCSRQSLEVLERVSGEVRTLMRRLCDSCASVTEVVDHLIFDGRDAHTIQLVRFRAANTA